MNEKLLNVIILFGSLAFIVMWVDQFLYKDISLKDSYFFLMFGIAGLLYYIYRRGEQKIKKDSENKNRE